MNEYPAEIGQLIDNPPIRACGNFLLVRVKEVEKVSKGGIALPTDHVIKEQMGCAHGHVISIGDEAWSDSEKGHWCELGDYIVFHRYEGVTPQVDGLDDGKLRIIADIKVLGVIA